MLEPLLRNEDVARHRVEIDVPEGLLVPLDTKLMGQVVTNLVLNGAQAMQDAGTLAIRARPAGGEVEVTVTDAGPGIEPERLGTIFDPFVTTKSRGTGLGLSIARKNVESHGGSLSAESRLGEGACFRIVLPLGGAAPTST